MEKLKEGGRVEGQGSYNIQSNLKRSQLKGGFVLPAHVVHGGRVEAPHTVMRQTRAGLADGQWQGLPIDGCQPPLQLLYECHLS